MPDVLSTHSEAQLEAGMQVLSGKMCKSWQGGCMSLPPGEWVIRNTYRFHLFVQQEFTCTPPGGQQAFSSLFFFFLPLLEPPVAAAHLLGPLWLSWSFIRFLQKYCLYSNKIMPINLGLRNIAVLWTASSSLLSYLAVKSVLILSFMSQERVLYSLLEKKKFPFLGQHGRQRRVPLST